MEIPTSELIGLPLHTLSDGKIAASFGASTNPHRPYLSYLNSRRLALADDESFWAAHRLRYELELWTAEGDQLRRISRRVRWFEPTSEWHGFQRDRPTAPLIADIETDENGYIRVLIDLADLEWEQAIERVQDEHGERWIPSSAKGYFDTILEVINPTNNEVLVHTRFDEMLTRSADAHHVVAPRQDEAEAVVRVGGSSFNLLPRGDHVELDDVLLYCWHRAASSQNIIESYRYGARALRHLVSDSPCADTGGCGRHRH